ncbi:hypothetical protein Fot_24222 [Forsythia ovata]|uniref:Uncharacterized protein n=1 Tax=Forsythia ovata TaxID=205694 RepID=A0ABD1U5M3_9LAMI
MLKYATSNKDCHQKHDEKFGAKIYLVRALENSGSDLEVAIKRLNEVRLSTTAIELDVTQGLDAPFQLKVDYLYIDEGNMCGDRGGKIPGGMGTRKDAPPRCHP